MPMSWEMRQHGWTCRNCGTFNPNCNFNCEYEECQKALKREDQQYRVFSRWEPRDVLLARSLSGMLYQVRRFVGGKLTYTVLVPGGYRYTVEWYRAPHSVVSQAADHFAKLK